MKDYQLEICKALQHDIKEISGQEWDINTVHAFWLEWSNCLSAGFLGYKQGDFDQLKWAIDFLSKNLQESE